MSVFLIAASLFALAPSPAGVASAGTYRGALAPSTQITLYVSLPGRHQEQIDALIAAQNAPGSPLYGR